MADTNDDWMNPNTSVSFTSPPPKNGTYYQIQRKRAIPVSGNVAFIYRWDMWEEFEDKDERDKKLSKLRDDHPAWHLRGRVVTYIDSREIGPDPTEYIDF